MGVLLPYVWASHTREVSARGQKRMLDSLYGWLWFALWVLGSTWSSARTGSALNQGVVLQPLGRRDFRHKRFGLARGRRGCFITEPHRMISPPCILGHHQECHRNTSLPLHVVLSLAFHSPRRKEEGLQIYWILNIFGPHYRSGSYGKNIITAIPMLDNQVLKGDPLKESSPTNTPCFSRCLLWFPLSILNQSWKLYLYWLLQQKDHICM